MFLFKAKYVPMILQLPGYRPKTQTRRLDKRPRAKVGSIHLFYSGGMPFSQCPRCGGDGGETGIVEEDYASMGCPACQGTGLLQPFGAGRMLRVWQENLVQINDEDIAKEGYSGTFITEFVEQFAEVNHIKFEDAVKSHPWCYEWEPVDLACARQRRS